MRIYLIGLPHSGKTSVGKLLAKMLDYDFIDMNVEIEKEALMFIDEVYEIHGKKTISHNETILLEKFMNKDNFVLATNSEVIMDKKNKKFLDGHIILLDVDEDTLIKRMSGEEMSYLLNDIALADYYQNTFLKYRSFATAIVNNNHNLEKTLEELTNVISKLENK